MTPLDSWLFAAVFVICCCSMVLGLTERLWRP
jgi:hypothetical protein